METKKEVIAEVGMQVRHWQNEKVGVISDVLTSSIMVNWGDGEYSGSDAKHFHDLKGNKLIQPIYAGSTKFEKESFISIEKSTELGQEIAKVMKKRSDCIDAANTLAKELGGTHICSAFHKLGGGIAAIEFPNGKPSADWKVMGEKGDNLFYPKIKAKELLGKIEALPTLEYEEFTSIIGFPTPQTSCGEKSILWISHPKMETTETHYLLIVEQGCRMAIKDGMTIVSKSEYYALKGE